MKNQYRVRKTWAGLTREATAQAPALPGYGVEDQDHPAHQMEPDSQDYLIGDGTPSTFAEDVRRGPYGDSGAPALPGYGVEDQDHPAHQNQIGRQATLTALVRQRAQKATRLAKAMLGRTASEDVVVDQAMALMDMDDDALDASLDRMSGGFLANDEEDDFGFEANDEDDGFEVMASHRLAAENRALQRELAYMRKLANQNDPDGDTLAPGGKSEDEVKKEEAGTNKSASVRLASLRLARLFDACDMDNDGFVTEDDWAGDMDMFNELDEDNDGILARHEVLANLSPRLVKKLAKKAEDDEEDEGEEPPVASKKKAKKAEDEEGEEPPVASKKKAKKAEDDEEDEGDEPPVASKKKAKKAEDEEDEEPPVASKKKKAKKAEDDEGEEPPVASKKKAFGHFSNLDEDELQMLEAARRGGEDDGLFMEASEDEGDDDEISDKEASEFFGNSFDPMGLGDGEVLTASDESLLQEIFGQRNASEDEDDDEGDAPSEKEASLRRLAQVLKPQPRTASKGVRSVGNVKVAGTKKNIEDDLSALWASAPDVSGSFT